MKAVKPLRSAAVYFHDSRLCPRIAKPKATCQPGDQLEQLVANFEDFGAGRAPYTRPATPLTFDTSMERIGND